MRNVRGVGVFSEKGEGIVKLSFFAREPHKHNGVGLAARLRARFRNYFKAAFVQLPPKNLVLRHRLQNKARIGRCKRAVGDNSCDKLAAHSRYDNVVARRNVFKPVRFDQRYPSAEFFSGNACRFKRSVVYIAGEKPALAPFPEEAGQKRVVGSNVADFSSAAHHCSCGGKPFVKLNRHQPLSALLSFSTRASASAP